MVRRPIDLAAGVVVAAAAVVLAVATPRPVMPAFLPIGDYAAYGPADAPARVALEPVLHAPWCGAVGRPVSAAITVVVLLSLWMAARRIGATAWAAAATALAFAARPDIGTPLALGAPALGAMACVWLAAVALTSAEWRSLVRVGVAGGVFVVACAWWPPVFVLTPLAVAMAAVVVGVPGAITLLGAAIVGTLGGAWIWAARATAMSDAAIGLVDVWRAVTTPVLATSSPFPWPPLAVAQWPVALAAAGAIVWLAGARRRAAIAVAAVASALAVWRWGAMRPEFVRACYWCAWPLVGVGLTWLTARATAARRPLVLGLLSLVLVGSGLLARLRQTELVEPESFAATLAAALEPGDGATVTVVAEDPRVDTALVAWGGARLQRLPVSVDAVTRVAPHRIVLAGPVGRATLELWGMRFAAGPTVNSPVPFAFSRLDGAVPCLSVGPAWTDLTTLAPTARWGVHVPAGDGRVELIVDGATSPITRVATVDGRTIGAVATLDTTSEGDGSPSLAGAGPLQHLTIPARADFAIDEAVTFAVTTPRGMARVAGAPEARICAAP